MAITNQRIFNIADGKFTFMAKDYRDKTIKKPVTLDGVEFLRSFIMHILPRRFVKMNNPDHSVKIRRFRIYNHTAKRNLALQFTVEEKPDIDAIIKQQQLLETNVERFERLTDFNLCMCPMCKIGRMVVVRELPRIGSLESFPQSIITSLLLAILFCDSCATKKGIYGNQENELFPQLFLKQLSFKAQKPSILQRTHIIKSSWAPQKCH